MGYRALADWTDRAGNSNTEDGLLVAWPMANDFAIAEEVALRGGLGRHERRPDRCCTSTTSRWAWSS